MSHDDDLPGDPVCYADMLVGGYVVDQETFRDVSRFRKSERVRLYEKRKGLTSTERTEKTAALIDQLRTVLEATDFQTISFYWPIRGEPDLRALMADLSKVGKTVLLPVVLEKQAPLAFRPWQPGCAMTRGVWNIPVPEEGPSLVPEVVIAPLVGVDAGFYRLGNGGGYYDRTLASLPAKPLTIGVGFAFCRLPSIFPMPWDVRMDKVVLDTGEET
ncbi:5-formyltetrahydrofolate cyclo-ligase [Stappia sp. BW2]|uniref:5-formyltetrahydrofolate cyclo-ligase n=1 Tax=Stappia sp. BW2 TaxID=2592622 RepID=UPI0011DE6A0D|nr:5-formyltetrahydrofolate cyclo-ligase [Stappia sp. BW2]TYC67178.1 5-formyltetrahydrofolate cyclo-ligase [Stappia sp. BW2]